MPVYLSKSDFQLGAGCAKKLVYKKNNYPTSNDTNEYMEMLAQGGYVIGKMATLLFPEGIEIDGNTEACIAETSRLLQREQVVLFEAAILAGQKLIRADILVKNGTDLHLIEVKSKSFDSDEATINPDLNKYIEDAAYQYHVLQEAFPAANIRCSLLMPDKAKRTTIEALAGWFSIVRATRETDTELEELPAQQKPTFRKPEVIFKYENDSARTHFVQQLMNDGILSYLDVTEKVIQQQPMIAQRANSLLRILNTGISSTDYRINKNCKGCEFNSHPRLPNGYQECWGSLGQTEPNIFDLYYGGAIGHHSTGYYFDELIDGKKGSLFDIELERLQNAKGELGSRGIRQMLQIQNTRTNTEWISPELDTAVRALAYPLHFIDFETYTGAIPFHAGMRPYELIAFQWSCHTIPSPGAKPLYSEWIHTAEQFPDPDAFPNFAFAQALKSQIGSTGTPLMWATHENTVLRGILYQMEHYNYQDEVLKEWLLGITRDDKQGRKGRLVDMNKMTLDYYFHPYMKGRTSIKKVLPAIWSHFPELHAVPHFREYAPETFLNGIIDPYDQLMAGLPTEDLDDEVVKGGTAAMRAYHRLRFDDSLTANQKVEIRRQLLQYCKLDTMAMVIIGWHWGMR